jgi:quinol---cytochrome-c reductase cytochrome b subunit
MSDPILDPVRFVDERTAAAPLLKRALRYLFPDHWSFLLGEIALYSFVVLVLTGTYLALFFEPSLAKTVYHGAYAPLRGREVSAAYKSVVEISLTDKAGLLIRQTHHWAADVFVASIVLHLLRVFFTGAFRRPRELTWLIGLALLFTSLLEGYLGYSLVDDLLSGIGLAIGYGVLLSVPVVGGPLGILLFGSSFPGTGAFESRMYIAHVFLIPALLAALIGAHLALVAARHHTQFRRDRRHTERRLVGVPMFPGQAPRSLALMFAVAGVLFLLGGLVQINPIWQWGPYHPWLATNGAQPDWYLGWLIGALRLMPSFDVVIGHYTLIPNPFWGGIAFPLLVVGVLASFPFAEARLARDRRAHNILDRPRDAPLRTAFGIAFLCWIALVFIFGAADRLYVLFGISYETLLTIFRIAIWVVPAALFVLTRRLCRELRRSEQTDLERERAVAEATREEEAMRARGEPVI